MRPPSVLPPARCLRPWSAAVGLALLVALTLLPGCGVGYILDQGFGQLAMLSRRAPIARVLQDPALPARMRDRLTLVWYARRFAERDLGLHAGESYTDVVLLDRDSASYVVSAAQPWSLDPYRWCFPIAGCLPYIGYFNRADAERERRRLMALGYDTSMRGVAAYSLGGWLPDPIYSPMLDDSRGDVANTVIHELTHGTVFLPGRARFNEGFATFVGDHGELLFLAEHYGAHSATLAEARAAQADARVYNAYLHDLVTELRALYRSGLPRAEILRRRVEVYAAARVRAQALTFRTPRYARVGQRVLNNAVLATHGTYYGAEAGFEAAFQRAGGDLRRFIALVRDDVARQPDPEAYLDRWSRTQAGSTAAP